MEDQDIEDTEDEPIVRFLTRDEKAVEDFMAGQFEHLRASGYKVVDGVLTDNFGDAVILDEEK